MLTIDSTCTIEPTLIASPALKDDIILIGSNSLPSKNAYNTIDHWIHVFLISYF